MSEEQTPNVAPEPNVAVLFAELRDEIKALRGSLEKKAPTKGGLVVVADEADKAIKARPYTSFGEFLMDVKNAAITNELDPRLKSLRSDARDDEGAFSINQAMGDKFVGSLQDAAKAAKAPTGLGELVDSAGGFLVGRDSDTSIMARVYNVGQLLPRLDMTGISANSNGMSFYAEDETSRADGSRRGGIRGYWASEAGAFTASTPKFRKMDLTLKKVTALVYATDEMLADAGALESWVMRNLPEELVFTVENKIFNGLGGGVPVGLLTCPALISVAKETGQAADTIVAQNIINMYARMWAPSVARAVWYVDQSTFPQLMQMSLGVGTGGVLVYVPPGGLSGSPYGSIFGRPVVPTEYNVVVGTVGDIIFADLGEIQAIDKGGIQSASSMHVRFLNAEMIYRFIYRVDFQHKWNSTLTPKSGGDAVSPVVVLASRD